MSEHTTHDDEGPQPIVEDRGDGESPSIAEASQDVAELVRHRDGTEAEPADEH